jgi:hypothetical protein
MSEAEVEEAPPQYFRRSAFRDHPDVEHEAKILAALKDIERMARKASGDGAKETIWQVMLKDGWDTTTNARGPDSISFEQRNPEWSYQVSGILLLSLSKEHSIVLKKSMSTAGHQRLGRLLSHNNLLHCAGPFDSIQLIPL